MIFTISFWSDRNFLEKSFIKKEKKMEMEDKENKDAEFIKEVMRKDRLSIARISPEVKQEFVQYAKEQYCDDYGAAFQAIWNYFKHDQKDMMVLDRLIDLRYRVDKLEANQPSTKKTIKMLDGKSEVKK